MTPIIHRGDCRQILRSLPDCSVDAVVTDPPYGLRFMGKKWDCDVPGTETWAECLRVLKPGGHLLAFAGTRTQHRMAVRIEDAGFEIRDMIAWVYGSGFPKSLDVSKATDAARQWQGWGTALKPALEPITVARKPLVGTVGANVLAHGTGALNINGCRVPGMVTTNPLVLNAPSFQSASLSNQGETGAGTVTNGRWPANLIHDGSDEVMAGFPVAPGQSGEVTGDEPSSKTNGVFGQFNGRRATAKRGDLGSAARFFYCAKATRKDRDEGLEHFKKRLAPSSVARVSQLQGKETTCISRTKNPKANIHPTVKPTDLMRYLCRLVTPPGGLVLDPFAGSGSTGKAAVLEGFRFIGCELSDEYADIAEARIAAALASLKFSA